MASHLPEASRTRARTRKEDSFAGCFSKAEHGRRKGRSLGVKGTVLYILFIGFETSGPGAESSGSGTRQRVSSVSGGLGGGGGTDDDSREVIAITDSEDEGSDKAISVSGSGEEEEESSYYGPQMV